MIHNDTGYKSDDSLAHDYVPFQQGVYSISPTVEAIPLANVQPVPVDYRVAARGGQPGGYYEHEKYCGLLSLLIGIFLLPCICCCPVDEREVYIEPSGRRIHLE